MHDEGHLAHLAALFNDSRYADIVLVAEAPHAEEDVYGDVSDCGSSCGSSGSFCGERESPRPERRRFHCHRAILASRSTYFDRMFGSGAAPVSFCCCCVLGNVSLGGHLSTALHATVQQLCVQGCVTDVLVLRTVLGSSLTR